jgi:hypothetical protein
MTESSHAQHRPPVDEDPSQLGPTPAGTTSFGTLYPLNDVLAVVDDHSEAERAVQALKDAGVRDGDVDVMEGAWFAEAVRGIERRGGLAARLAKILPTDEQLMLRRYMAEAEQGHSVVVVHAESPQDVERAGRILGAHGGHEMRHYGHMVITDL